MLKDEIGHRGQKSIGGRQRDSAHLYVKLCGGESRVLRQFAATALHHGTDWVGAACDKGRALLPVWWRRGVENEPQQPTDLRQARSTAREPIRGLSDAMYNDHVVGRQHERKLAAITHCKEEVLRQ